MKPIVNYGLSDSLIDAVRKSVEEAKLHPNQQKLDVHEPEKDELTSQDFKKLRSGKKVKDGIDTKPKLKEEDEREYVKETDEEKRDTHVVTLTRGTTVGARSHRMFDVHAASEEEAIKKANAEHKKLMPDDNHKQFYVSRVHEYPKMNEEEEQMDEISSELAGRASNARIDRNMSGGTSHTDIRKLKKGITPLDQQTKTIAGYTKTLDRKNEEDEQMDEVKLADLPRRMVKGTSYGANYVDPEGADETAADMKKPEPKRKSGPQGTMKRRFNTKSYTSL